MLAVEKIRLRQNGSMTEVLFENEKLIPSNADWLWPRLGPLSRDAGLTLLKGFESAGFRLVNSATATALASDKIESLLQLSESGLAIPRTWFFHPCTQWRTEDLVATTKFWIKTRTGSQGLGVSWADCATHALAQVDLIRMSQGSGLLQEHITGEDVRVLVWRQQVLASMKREANKLNPRANLSQGAHAFPFTPSTELASLAVQATRAMGLQFAGVDFLVNGSDAKILEVNPSPGLVGLTTVSGRDLASELLQTLRTTTK